MIWQPRLDQERRLAELDEIIARTPDVIDASVERAALLNALDRQREAQQAYIDVLKRAPTHFGALNDFGALLSAMGHRTAARTVYTEAIAHHPGNPRAHVNLANLLALDGEHASARAHFEIALRIDPEHPQAHQGLARLFADIGDETHAALHRRKGFAREFITTLPYRGTQPPVPLLLLVSAAGGDIPTASFLDNTVFLTTAVVADFFDRALPLPPHQLVFNAIGDADLCRDALTGAVELLKQTDAAIINPPAAVLKTGRAVNAQRLAGIRGVIAPRISKFSRAALASADASAALSRQGFAFPLLFRSPGFHTGRNFVMANAAGDLPSLVDELPGDDLLVIDYLDARGRDGHARKYRVMFIDGRLYPLHLAISSNWKVHYFTADMANAGHRAEEAAFLADMPGVLGSKAMTALDRIRQTLDLDYGGIDFGLNARGDVLLFEANATMVVNPPDPDARFAYRVPAVTRILDAVKAMLMRRAKLRHLDTAARSAR